MLDLHSAKEKIDGSCGRVGHIFLYQNKSVKKYKIIKKHVFFKLKYF